MIVEDASEFTRLSKNRRQLICVRQGATTAPDPAQVVAQPPPSQVVANRPLESVELAASVAKKIIQAGRANPAVAIGAVGVAGVAFAGTWAWKSWDSRRKDKAGVTYVSRSVADGLDFPEGPYVPGVVYALHPLIASTYVRVCNLNLYVLQSRISEYSTIMRSLGACEFDVEGSDEDSMEVLGLSFSLPAPVATPVDARLAGRATESAAVSYYWRGPGGRPDFDRRDSVWLAKDPVLADIVSARLQGRLHETKVEFRPGTEMEISPKLAGVLAASKLDLGGHLRHTTSASFRLHVKFPEGAV